MALSMAQAGGKTALYDAVHLALVKLNGYRTERRRVILLITDGMDTASRHASFKETRQLVRESDVQIYAIGILGSDTTLTSLSVIEGFAEVTGGRAFFPTDPEEMIRICYGVAVELHQQYSLGYRPTNEAQDGRWRKVKVKIKHHKGRHRLVARTRHGYYAPGRD
ncbi:MAG: VWA domain-containing protein [Acidobacteria bacterium]|nr:MAG: VWA domain-containing protein [Acidobacteriota bacterium]